MAALSQVRRAIVNQQQGPVALASASEQQLKERIKTAVLSAVTTLDPDSALLIAAYAYPTEELEKKVNALSVRKIVDPNSRYTVSYSIPFPINCDSSSWVAFNMTLLREPNNEKYRSIQAAVTRLLTLQGKLASVEFECKRTVQYERGNHTHFTRTMIPAQEEYAVQADGLRKALLQVVFFKFASSPQQQAIGEIVQKLFEESWPRKVETLDAEVQTFIQQKASPYYNEKIRENPRPSCAIEDDLRKHYERLDYSFFIAYENIGRFFCKTCNVSIQADPLCFNEEQLVALHDKTNFPEHVIQLEAKLKYFHLTPQKVQESIREIDSEIQELTAKLNQLQLKRKDIAAAVTREMQALQAEEVASKLGKLQAYPTR